MQSLRQTNPVSYALSFINTENTKYNYRQELWSFFSFISSKYLGLPSDGDLEQQGQAFLDKALQDQSWAQEVIMSFLGYHKKRVQNKEFSPGSLKTYSKPIKLFCDMNDITSINWKRIIRSLPKARNVANDRAYSRQEIQQLIDYADRRLRAIVLVMCSAGFRRDAWTDLKWGHVIPIDQDGQIVAAKLRVYADDAEEYYTFMTPEAYSVLTDWMNYRAAHGEQISPESWLMRDVWRTSDVKLEAGGRYGLAAYPKKIKSSTVKRLLERALKKQGMRERKLSPQGGAIRYDVKVCHGLRKFFNTRLHEVMDDTKVRILMGQSTGISDNYNRPDENKLLVEYRKAVPLLTINHNDEAVAAAAKDNENVKNQLKELQQQQQKMIQFFNTQVHVMVRNTIEQELSKTEKEKPGIKKLIERGNRVVHWGEPDIPIHQE